MEKGFDQNEQNDFFRKRLELSRAEEEIILKANDISEAPLGELDECSPPKGPYNGRGGDGPGGPGEPGGPGDGAGGYICPFESLDMFVKFYSALDSRYIPLTDKVEKIVKSAKTKAKSLYERGYTSLNGKSKYFTKAADKLENLLTDVKGLSSSLVKEQIELIRNFNELSCRKKIMTPPAEYAAGQIANIKQVALQLRMSYLATREVVKKYELFFEEKKLFCESMGRKPEAFVSLIGQGYETVVQ